MPADKSSGGKTDLPLARIQNDTSELDGSRVDELAHSMTVLGKLLHQITVVSLEDGGLGFHYRVVAGHHRHAAAKQLGWKMIPAVVIDEELVELATIDENLIRKKIGPAEEAALTARRQEVYEKLHGGDRKARGQIGHEAERFSANQSSLTGKAERSVRRAAHRGKELGADALKLKGTSLDQGDELDALIGLPEDKRADIIARAAAGERVSAKVAKKQHDRNMREVALGGKQMALPEERFGLILADPATTFVTWFEAGMSRAAGNHYPTLGDVDELIAKMTEIVGKVAADDSLLLLWTTVAQLRNSLRLMTACSFDYKSAYAWVKGVIVASHGDARHLKIVDNFGTGYWGRDRLELMLIGARGKPIAPAMGTQGENVWFAARGEHAATREDEHSDKPECSYQWIEKHWPHIPRIELYARRKREGWAVWGNEVAEDAPPARQVSPPVEEAIVEEAAEEDDPFANLTFTRPKKPVLPDPEITLHMIVDKAAREKERLRREARKAGDGAT